MRAKVLYPLMMANADDQGRVSAEAQVMKWEVCPNIQEITPEDIPELLTKMEDQGLVRVYDAGGIRAAQLVLWWADQSSMQWAYPSPFNPQDGWNDRLRFRQGGQVITVNWPNKTDGTSNTPLAELAPQLVQEPSLAIAIGKALGNAPLGNPLPNPLAKDALPEATRVRGRGRVTEEEDSVPSAEVTGSSEPPDTSTNPPGLSPPVSYRDWAALLEEATNGRESIGTLADFAMTQYPAEVQGGSRTPTLQQVSSNIGGMLTQGNLDPVDLLKVMWRATANVPEGDFLAYVRGVVKRQEAANGGEQRAAGDGAGDWSGLPVDAAEEATGET